MDTFKAWDEMNKIEDWPYGDDKKRSDLYAKLKKAEKTMHRAELKMRRSFTAWEKARATHKRLTKLLER